MEVVCDPLHKRSPNSSYQQKIMYNLTSCPPKQLQGAKVKGRPGVEPGTLGYQNNCNPMRYHCATDPADWLMQKFRGTTSIFLYL